MFETDTSLDRVMPTTQWLLVEQGRAALPELYVRYRPAIRAHLVITHRVPRTDVDDIIHEFVASQMLTGHMLESADQNKGRFRTFLLTALDRFVFNLRRRSRTRTRLACDGARTGMSAETFEAASDPCGDAYDVAWARQILTAVVQQFRSRCEVMQRQDIWGVFECRLLRPILEGQPPASYEELAARYQFKSPGQAANVLITAKRMYMRILRGVVAEYARSEEEIDEEINDLIRILSAARAEANRIR